LNNKVRLAEPIFLSIQDEGLRQGKRALFIRFFGCNLSCEICDTKYSWKKIDEIVETNFINIIDEIKRTKAELIVFTGGEPLLKNNLKVISEILLLFMFSDKVFEIETNGTLDIPYDYLKKKPIGLFGVTNIWFNISPKGNIKQENKKTDTKLYLLQQLKDYDFKRYIVKFLLNDKRDFDYIDNVVLKYNIPLHKVYIQPIGINKEEILQKIKVNFNEIINRGYNISFRLHRLLFNNKKGV